MPAGAFAASGPTSDESSKARSRRARGTRAVRTPSQTMTLAHANDEPGSKNAAPHRTSPRNKTVSKKYFGTMSWGLMPSLTPVRVAHLGLTWRLKPAESGWCLGPVLAEILRSYINV